MDRMFAEAMAAISAGKTALDMAKTMAAVVNDLGKTDLKLKAAELTQKITELTHQVTELALQNAQLHQQAMESDQAFKKLEERLKIRDELVVSGNAYMRKKPDGTEDGPFCFRCFDLDGVLVRMVLRRGGYILCRNCEIKRGAQQ